MTNDDHFVTIMPYRRLKDLVHCMEDLQSTCYWYKDFFPYRQLVTALRAAIDWTCQRQEQGPPPPFRSKSDIHFHKFC